MSLREWPEQPSAAGRAGDGGAAVDHQFKRFIEKRRREQARSRRERNLWLVVGALAGVCVILAVANVVLATRLMAARSPAPVTVAAPEPAALASTAPPPEAPRGPVTAAREPEAPAPPREAAVPPAPSAPPSLPPRAAEPEAGAPSASPPSGSTAAWMIEAYGRKGAEDHVRRVVEFYGPGST
ncbi:MAG TPA: hypothetical protein VFX28_17065, partial [Methylomirabilota bacterium]|nr:hypothetical protein [Methylomirabilota bacterium]